MSSGTPHAIDDPGAIIELESSLLEADVRANYEALERVLHPDFVEFGASGRAWSRERTLLGLSTTRATEEIGMSECDVCELGRGVALLTYRSAEPASGRTALRSSVWVWHDGAWRMRFHQGTPISSEAAGR
ncbi:MAG: DUF4440 domain-containing protein [Phycisphaerales bacterium]